MGNVANLKPFTSETAAEAARRGAITRRRKRDERRAREERDRARVKAMFEADSNGQNYVETRLARIRAALDRYDELVMIETDPQKASWLATVIAKLSEIERMLAGRPAPGQLRPSTGKRSAGLPTPLIPG
jgi:hypothetical protein